MGYTKKQRREIYLESAELIFLKEYHRMCIAFERCTNEAGSKSGLKYSTITDYYIDVFPEFLRLSPESYQGTWWCTVRERDNRINALLLMAEMCKN